MTQAQIAPTEAPTAQIRQRESLFSAYRTEIAIALAIVLLVLAVGSQVPQALTWGNFANITQAGAPLIIMSLGVLLVVVTGGIDLSIGSVFSLTGMVTAQAMAHGLGGVSASLIGLCVGLLFGSINGFLVTIAGLAPFVVTLITFAVAGSLAFIVTNGRSMPIGDPDFWLLNSGNLIPGIPNYILFCVVLMIAIEFFLKKLIAGRWFYAVGSSSTAAYLLGVPVKRTKFMAYVASSLLASFSGLLTISYILNAESTAGSSLMLQAIAAVVIGGASLLGGTGTAIGAVLGALMITVIQNGVNLIGINSFWQGSVTGVAILIAVLIDRFSKSRRGAV
ncbi:ribose ABC transporter permease protein (plasmid) [Rhizobium etli 8C-3]|uniref:Ribose transport system permease protein n=2 Tax=Rhizobium TaxID=379 RepID=A0A4V2VFQ9_9HYPH|nr:MULTISPECIES: ABC transporter permease [Rhizobium]APO79791.1 ribose ABC transporter permease protein [Rhizobium etli 8C-3]TCU30584.1 ribose transport system permease protein [Rhizobium azibense]TCU41405.1 ribose transport system permease protein [Rhizobium azibense]